MSLLHMDSALLHQAEKMLGLRSWVRKDECDKLLIWEKLSSSDQNYNEDKE